MDPQVGADCLGTAFCLAAEGGELDCHGLVLTGIYLGALPLEGLSVRDLQLKNCLIDDVTLDEVGLTSTITISDSDIQHCGGIADQAGLPSTIFRDCTVETFDDHSTNAAIVRSNLSAGKKALLTVLRKLYLQAGGGRKLNALRRGLPAGQIADAVDGVIRVLESEGLAVVDKGIVHPVRRHASRVRAILAAGGLSADPVVQEVSPQQVSDHGLR
jgi:hypothetical protein